MQILQAETLHLLLRGPGWENLRAATPAPWCAWPIPRTAQSVRGGGGGGRGGGEEEEEEEEEERSTVNARSGVAADSSWIPTSQRPAPTLPPSSSNGSCRRSFGSWSTV
ncbi:unnamed protein product [Prorocentrum cordatum]|uniref:Uncharacterized protein n=1 Tax=Prorocentrum cordatum TaxID=2364126 RepID=A0ABN9SZU8_9DINO|nr:unnamed protein product [Polarella glacialis]